MMKKTYTMIAMLTLGTTACGGNMTDTESPDTVDSPETAEADEMASEPASAGEGLQEVEPDDGTTGKRGPEPLATVIVAITDYVGAPVEGTAEVDEVISDRGFWLGSGDDRVFAVVREDVPEREMIDINAGQRLTFNGVVLSQESIDDVAGTLEPDAVDAIMQEPAFIAMYWKDVELEQ